MEDQRVGPPREVLLLDAARPAGTCKTGGRLGTAFSSYHPRHGSGGGLSDAPGALDLHHPVAAAFALPAQSGRAGTGRRAPGSLGVASPRRNRGSIMEGIGTLEGGVQG